MYKLLHGISSVQMPLISSALWRFTLNELMVQHTLIQTHLDRLTVQCKRKWHTHLKQWRSGLMPIYYGFFIHIKQLLPNYIDIIACIYEDFYSLVWKWRWLAERMEFLFDFKLFSNLVWKHSTIRWRLLSVIYLRFGISSIGQGVEICVPPGYE